MEALLKRSRNPAAFCHCRRSRIENVYAKTKRLLIVPGHVQNTGGWMTMLDREQPIVCTDTLHHQQHQRVEVASRPASPAPCESKRLGAPTNRTFVPKSFTRKAGDLRTLNTAQDATTTTAAGCCMGVGCRCTRYGLTSREVQAPARLKRRCCR